MKIVEEFPPQWNEISKIFPHAAAGKQVLITIGEICYNPFKLKLRPDLIAHEEVHSKQQLWSGDVDGWIQKYLHDSTFRFEAELEAYAVQLIFIRKNIGQREYKQALKFYARSLSGPIYGKICSEEYALNKLKQCVLSDNLSAAQVKQTDI